MISLSEFVFAFKCTSPVSYSFRRCCGFHAGGGGYLSLELNSAKALYTSFYSPLL